MILSVLFIVCMVLTIVSMGIGYVKDGPGFPGHPNAKMIHPGESHWVHGSAAAYAIGVVLLIVMLAL